MRVAHSASSPPASSLRPGLREERSAARLLWGGSASQPRAEYRQTPARERRLGQITIIITFHFYLIDKVGFNGCHHPH